MPYHLEKVMSCSSSTSNTSNTSNMTGQSQSEASESDTPGISDRIDETFSVITTDEPSVMEEEPPLGSRLMSPVPQVINARAYQREMFEKSLQRNVIVAMDTGSGKTQVAVLRIQAELAKASQEKIVWFLAPTVSLCVQQFKVIQGQMPSISMKLLTGEAKVDSWSRNTWLKLLRGTRLVVSTPQILLDALDHAFVSMARFALLVFDEVHNCVKNNPGSKIMQNFYHSEKLNGRPVPPIMGLTASPIISSKLKSVKELEATMNAVCITPTIHREELLRMVNKPHLLRCVFESQSYIAITSFMHSFREMIRSIDPTTDPHVLRMRTDRSEEGRRKVLQMIMKNESLSQTQLEGLWTRSKTIQQELGDWAADVFIKKTIEDFLNRVGSSDEFFNEWLNEDRIFLANHLRQLVIPASVNNPPEAAQISEKATKLINQLVVAGKGVVGIIFVKERATVGMLCELLNSIPSVRRNHRAGAMVGTSSNGARKKNMYDLMINIGTQALEDFRAGAINLLVATSVLEEGIDVPHCNLVVCFDETSTLKAFIQRRGRARMQESKMIAFERTDASLRAWEDLETGMKEEYQKDQRELDRLEELAMSESTDSIFYIIESTGARLDIDNAKKHLEHFCQVVFAKSAINYRPEYIFHRDVSREEQLTRAQVVLPPSLPVHLRQFESSRAWISEKNATKDAAFHAYLGLYREGMVDQHLLPILETVDPLEVVLPIGERIPEPLINPWAKFGPLWRTNEDKWFYTVRFYQGNDLVGQYGITLPVQVQKPRTVQIHVDSEEAVQWRLEFDQGQRISHDQAMQLSDHTSTLVASHFGHRWPVEDGEHVIKVTALTQDLSRENIGAVPLESHLQEAQSGQYLLRDSSGGPYIWASIIPAKPSMQDVRHPFYGFEDAPEDTPYVVVDKWTRRSDWLHRLNSTPKSSSRTLYGRVLPASWVKVDTIPKHYVEFGMLLPSVIHELEVQLVATDLSSTLLKSVDISDLQLVVKAITAPSAREPVDYEWLEFIGDSILKLCAVIQVMAENLSWPESLLSRRKEGIISNSRLLRAALETGLSKYIISQSFTGQKWKPKYLDEAIRQQPAEASWRGLGDKSLADVVEALIGASYLDGGLPKAICCLPVFLGGNRVWLGEAGRDAIFNNTPSDVQLPPTLGLLEGLVGYSFQKKSLLIEAMTHISFMGVHKQQSLERLEFLGDAILDYIIVKRLAAVQPPLSVPRLHVTKSSMVHGDFLAFICMSLGLNRKGTVLSNGGLEETEEFLPLWKFMRHSIPTLPDKQAKLVERFESLREEIAHELECGQSHPWGLLSRLKAPKHLSDIVESLIGAVWVDSGSMETCEQVIRRLGIMPCLERLLKDNIWPAHPTEVLTDYSRTPTKYHFKQSKGLDGETEFQCSVEVGDQLVAEVEGMSTRNEAMTRAAEEALKMLMERKAGEMSEDMDLPVRETEKMTSYELMI